MDALGELWPPLAALSAYRRTRGLAKRLRTRADVEAWQSRQLARFLAEDVPAVPFYAHRPHAHLDDLPIIDKASLMADFAAFNRPGVTAAEGFGALDSGGRVRGHHVGASTGTSGNRGLYVISDSERWRWLGVMLAKTLPRLRRARVALVLPRNASLYDAARRSVLDFRFCDLSAGVDVCCAAVRAFAPDTIIAPPKILRRLAEADEALPLRLAFSAAEVLDPIDRAIIEARFGLVLRQIYMATEGVIAVSCAHGTLHLCEDTMHVELAPVGDGTALHTPIITDFSRSAQIMARYRMNDLLTLATDPCPCGSPLRAIARIDGRVDDMLQLAGPSGPVAITPDVLRNAVVGADPSITDFRIVQSATDTVELALAAALPDAAVTAATTALAAQFARVGVRPRIVVHRVAAFPISETKLRRVMRNIPP